jgi:hypothetical protein
MSGEDPFYPCSACEWTGDDYHLLDTDSSGGTAACPECKQPTLRLARAADPE